MATIVTIIQSQTNEWYVTRCVIYMQKPVFSTWDCHKYSIDCMEVTDNFSIIDFLAMHVTTYHHIIIHL